MIREPARGDHANRTADAARTVSSVCGDGTGRRGHGNDRTYGQALVTSASGRGLDVLGVPIDSEALAEGCNLTPGVLRAAGLIDALAATDLGDLDAQITDPRRDMVTGITAFKQICEMSQKLQRAVAERLVRPDQLLVVGGCCSVIYGIVGAMREVHGRVGLAFVDGHLDFYDGVSTPTGSAADIDLWVLTGFGPAGLADLGGPPPMLQPRDTWVLGFRDHEESLTMKSPDPLTMIPEAHFFDDQALKAGGASAIGGEAARALAADPGHFWVHVDLDVLSTKALPAVDYWQPGGLDWSELRDLVTPLVADPACLGLDVTIYNPSLDPRRRYAPMIVRLLADVFNRG
jgi:arginase